MPAPAVYTVFSKLTIATVSVANPAVLTFAEGTHGIRNGQSIVIAGHSGSTPDINGTRVATFISSTQVSIPLNVTVAGSGGKATVERFVRAGSIVCRQPSKGVDTLSVALEATDGAFRMAQWADIYLKKNGTTLFGGLVSTSDETAWHDKALSHAGTLSRLTAQGYKTYATWGRFTGTLAAGTWKSQLTTLVAELAQYGLSLSGSQADGPDMPETEHDDEEIASILNTKAESINWNWEVHPDTLALLSFAAGSLTCSNVAQADKTVIGDVRVSRRRESWYANRVVVKMGRQGYDPPQIGETYPGDGSTRTFLLKHALNFYGPLTIRIDRNGTPDPDIVLDYPADLYPTGTGPWSYDPVRYALVQDSGETVLGVNDELQFPYNYGTIHPATLIETDATAYAADGNRYKTHTIHLPDSIELDHGRALALAELTRRKVTLQDVEYTVNDSDAKPGRTHTLTFGNRSVSSTHTVNEIVTQHVSPFIVRQTISAVSGQYAVPTYREWYEKKDRVGAGGVGTSGTQTTPIAPGSDTQILFNRAGVIDGAFALWIEAFAQFLVAASLSSNNAVGFSAVGAGYSEILFGARASASGVTPADTSLGLAYFEADQAAANSPVMVFASLYRSLTADTDQSLPSVATEFQIGGLVNGTYHNGIAVLEKAGATGAVPGCVLQIQRNSAGNGAPGCLALQSKDGTIYYYWPTNAGVLRFATAPPEEDGTPADSSGTAV